MTPTRREKYKLDEDVTKASKCRSRRRFPSAMPFWGLLVDHPVRIAQVWRSSGAGQTIVSTAY